MIIHHYEYIYVHFTPMTTSEKLSQINLEIYKVDHQKRLTVNGNITFH
jgi:hypothetical protein